MIHHPILPSVKPRAIEEPASSALAPDEVPLVDICVRIAQFLGLPKSVGELYGLLFVSPVPLPLDACVERLNMSKGSASQGLKQLRTYGAIKPSYVPGDRRDHYIAETDLNCLVRGFFRERIQPGVADFGERLKRIGEEGGASSPGLEKRLAQLQQWQSQVEKLLPLLNTFLGK